MPKALAPKIYKVKKKTIDEYKENFVIKYKNLSKEKVKQLRVELDDVVTHFFDKAEIQEY